MRRKPSGFPGPFRESVRACFFCRGDILWVGNSRENIVFLLGVVVSCTFFGVGVHFFVAVPKKCTLGTYLRAVILHLTF